MQNDAKALRSLAVGLRVTATAAAAACSGENTTEDEAPIDAHGTIHGRVVGTDKQALSAIEVSLRVPAATGQQASFLNDFVTSDTNGEFSRSVQRIGTGQRNRGDTYTLYVAAAAVPPKYATGSNGAITHDSVSAQVQVGPVSQAAPVTVEITLPVAPPN